MMIQPPRCWISICGSRWTAVIYFKKCPVEASQHPACARQINAMIRVYATYSCIFQQRCSRSLSCCEVSSVCCWGKARLRKLLLHLNLKAVLFLIWWGRNLYSSLPSFGGITFSDCSNLPSGVDCIVVPLSSKRHSYRDNPLVDLKRTLAKLRFGSESH